MGWREEAYVWWDSTAAALRELAHHLSKCKHLLWSGVSGIAGRDPSVA